MYRLLVILGFVLIITLGATVEVGAQAVEDWAKPVKPCWVFQTDEMSSLASASDNEKTILLPLINGSVSAIDVDTGKSIWNLDLKNSINSRRILVNRTSLYLTGEIEPEVDSVSSEASLPEGKYKVYSVDIDSGINNWVNGLSLKRFSESLSISMDEKRIVVAANQGEVLSFDKRDRGFEWQVDLQTRLTTSPTIGASSILIGTRNKTIARIEKASGKILSQIPVSDVPSSLYVDSETIFVGDRRGFLRSFDPGENLRWRARTGGKIVEIAPIGNDLLVSSDDNFAYLFTKNKGKKRWKRKLAGRIIGKSILDNSVAVFLSSGSNEAVFVNLKNGKIVNRIEVGVDQWFVSPPRYVGGKVILPTNDGLSAFSPSC